MIYLFKNGPSNSDVTILYDKKLLPENINNFLSLTEEPVPPNDGNKYILCLTPNVSSYYWERIPEEDLTYLKEEKIKNSKEKLQQFLLSHPLYSNAHNGIFDYYTVTEEKQSLLTSEFMGYQVLKAAGIETNFSWNAEGKPCEVWKEEEGVQLIGEIRAYIKPLIEYQQKKEILIKAATTKEEIENILIDYDEVHDVFKIESSETNNNSILETDNLLLVDDVNG